MTLEKMSHTDPRTADRRTLVQVSTVRVDKNAPPWERYRQFVTQIGNPYCYMDGKAVVKITFANTNRTLEDCIHGYLSGI